MFVGTLSKLSNMGNCELLRLYDKDVLVVKQYNYLDVILDSEMNLHAFYNHVKKIVQLKNVALSKLQKCYTEYAAIMLYKHTMSPFLEYAGFRFTACSIGDRCEHQKCQNDALRIFLKIRLSDQIRIEDLHRTCKIVSLEQRGQNQLLQKE